MCSSHNKAADLSLQPIAQLMTDLKIHPKDLVTASTAQLTFKTIKKARAGKRLTRNSQLKILDALNTATQKKFALKDLFDY